MAGFLGFFDYTKPGKGVNKGDVNKKGISLYFDILLRKFWKLIPLNLIYIIASIPAIFIGWFISSFLLYWAVTQAVVYTGEVSTTLSLLCVFATIIFLHIYENVSGTAALTYVLGKYVNDAHAWVWSDFKAGFKNNFKQGISSYIINVAVFSLLIIAFFVLYL